MIYEKRVDRKDKSHVFAIVALHDELMRVTLVPFSPRR